MRKDRAPGRTREHTSARTTHEKMRLLTRLRNFLEPSPRAPSKRRLARLRLVLQRLKLFEPLAKMRALLSHSFNAHGLRCQRSVQRFAISRISAKHPFRRSRVRIVVNILGSTESRANYLKLLREMHLLNSGSESYRIAEQQPFVLV